MSTDAVEQTVTTSPKKVDSAPSKETDEALMQLVQGRRHLLVKDYGLAVAALAKGCELLAAKYGDTAPECGDAYLTYGRALLELARAESGVLGMEDEAGKNDAEDDADEDADEDEDDAEQEDGVEDEGVEAGVEDEGVEAKEEDGIEAGVEAKEETTNGEANGEVKKEVNGAKENGKKSDKEEEAKEGEDEEGEDGEEDVNNLQLAWEMLELAKVIFEKQLDVANDKATSLKLSEVYLKLGEVGVESENYSTAIEDINCCLELQRKYLAEDDRRIAETLYNLGMAYSLCNEFDSAIEQFSLARDQIEKRILNLEKTKNAPDSDNKGSSEDPLYTIEGEIEELKALLPEMKEKISDMHDFKKETMRRMMEGIAEASAKRSSTADGAGPSSASDKPVSSVAHLVKRKPKDEVKEDATVEQVAEKIVTEELKLEDNQDLSIEKKRKQEDSNDEAIKKLKTEDSS